MSLATDTAEVITPQEASLDGVAYRLDGPVRQTLISIIPGKLVIGNATRNDSQLSSAWTLNDASGGLLIRKVNPARDIDRGWTGNSETRYANAIGLPPLVTDRGTPASASDACQMFTLSDEVYCCFGTDLRIWDDTNEEWDQPGGSAITFDSAPTDAVYFDGKIWVATGDSNPITTWDGSALDEIGDGGSPEVFEQATYLLAMETKLYAMTASGTMRSAAYDDGTSAYVWADEAILDVPAADISGLTVFRDINSDPVLYVTTRLGMWYYDRAEKVFRASALQIPQHPHGGYGTSPWRTDMMYAAGLSVLKYSLNLINSVGLDRDDSLPSDQDGNIIEMIGGLNWLYTFVKNRETSSTSDPLYGGSAVGETYVMPALEAFSSLWATDGNGIWHRIWVSASTSGDITTAAILTSNDETRLWWGADNTVYSMDIPLGIHNPENNPVAEFAPSSTHISPWFDADWSEDEKLALGLRIGVKNLSATQRIRVWYGLDDTDGWTDLGWVDSSTASKPTGVIEFQFDEGVGFPFYSIRFRFDFERGTDSTKTPILRFFSLNYVKAIDTIFGYNLTIDFSQPHKGRTPGQMQAALEASIRKRGLLPFRYKDSAGHPNARLVRVQSYRGALQTAFDDRAKATVELTELRSQT